MQVIFFFYKKGDMEFCPRTNIRFISDTEIMEQNGSIFRKPQTLQF